MKRLTLTLMLAAMAFSSQTVFATPHHGHYPPHHERETITIEIERESTAWAHTPRYRQECWIEERRAPHHGSPYGHNGHQKGHRAAGGMIMGGLTGGLIGQRLGRGHDKGAFTLLGTLVGAAIGHDLAARPPHPVHSVHHEKRRIYRKRCRTVGYYDH